MPSLLRKNDCPACGRPHNFCRPTAHVARGDEYDFVCPETGRRATLLAGENGAWTATPPQGAVALEPAGQRVLSEMV